MLQPLLISFCLGRGGKNGFHRPLEWLISLMQLQRDSSFPLSFLAVSKTGVPEPCRCLAMDQFPSGSIAKCVLTRRDPGLR